MTTTIITAAKTSQHIGNVGDVVDIKGVTVMLFPGMTIVKDIDGNEFEVRHRRSIAGSKSVCVHITGEVVRHSTFRQVERTVIELRREYNVTDAHPFR